MISVIIQCFSKQEHLNHTLPRWLTQEGPDFEIILGIGPDIKIPQVPNTPNFKGITIVPLQEFKFCGNYNKILRAAHGDILCISYCDMEINNPLQLKNMLGLWDESKIVTDSVFRNGERGRYKPVFLDCTMISRAAVDSVGGWHEGYDNPESYAHEDGDMIASLMEKGLSLVFMETEPDKAIYHITHEAPDMGELKMQIRHKKGEELFFSRHKEGIMALYARQLLGMRDRMIKV